MQHSTQRTISKSPKWTFVELARRWGMTNHQLQSAIAKFPGFPPVEFRLEGNVARGRACYYDLHLAVKWYNAARAQLIADITSKQKVLDTMSHS